ncbi:Fluoroacetate dehalogenase [Seiridium cupressi]
MATTESHSITVLPDVIINIVTTRPQSNGDARNSPPALIFLHFRGGSSRTWSSIVPLLSPVYPTIAIDFRGWGASSGPADPDAYSTSDLADDVLAVIQKTDIAEFFLVGHSMGAKVAQVIAGRIASPTMTDPNGLRKNLRGLILIGPAPPTPLVLPGDMREQQVHAYGNAESAEFVARNVLTSAELNADTVTSLVQDMVKGNKWAREAWPAYVMGEDVSEWTGKIEVPSLVISAEKDVVEPTERVQREVVERLEKVQFVVLKGSGHLSPVEVPHGVADQMLIFLRGLEL